MDKSKLQIIWTLNTLNECQTLQTSINDLLENSSTTYANVKQRILQEEEVAIHQGQYTSNTKNTALIAVPGKNNRPICTNCKCANHCTEFCISAGGAMAGKTIEEARVAQDTAHAAQRSTTSSTNKAHSSHTNMPQSGVPAQANTAQTNLLSSVPNNQMLIDGVYYIPAPVNPPPADNSAHTAIVMAPYDEEEYITILATSNIHASMNWSSHTRSLSNLLPWPLPTLLDTSPLINQISLLSLTQEPLAIYPLKQLISNCSGPSKGTLSKAWEGPQFMQLELVILISTL